MSPKLLDLFCGAGGAAMGYHRAGFDVVGVDIAPQPRYPFEFHQGDALEFLAEHGHEFDVVHLSPPCQAYSRTGHLADAQGARRSSVRLIEPARAMVRRLGTPYVIENVEGAPLLSPLLLCGSMFGLRVRRHRLFEMSAFAFGLECDHRSQGRPVGVLNWGKWGHEIPNGGRLAESLADAQDAMDIDWMRRAELAEAIPPAYTEFIGRQLLAHLQIERAS